MAYETTEHAFLILNPPIYHDIIYIKKALMKTIINYILLFYCNGKPAHLYNANISNK